MSSRPAIVHAAEPQPRIAAHPIDPLFLRRWSPRAFEPSSMPASDLLTILEAARWAPSAFNLQPWRFVYLLRKDPRWDAYVALLDPSNAVWARHASALVFLVSDSRMPARGVDAARPAPTHSFDAGAAWAHLALQATALGYQVRAMAGIDFDAVRETLAVPERYWIEIAIAIGRQADARRLPAALREREVPSGRRPLSEIAARGSFADLAPQHRCKRGGGR